MKDGLTNICGARTKDGVCMNEPVPGMTRCHAHGGASTGAKTAEGRQRQSEAQKRRWDEIRAALAFYRAAGPNRVEV